MSIKYHDVNVGVTLGESGEIQTASFDVDLGPAASSIYGKVVVSGQFASFSGRVVYTPASGFVHVGTVPDGCRSAGKVLFYVGNGGTTNAGVGYIDPDGKIYINFSATYCYFEARWLVAEQSVALAVDTSKLPVVDGAISVNGRCAEMLAYFPSTSLSAGWHNNIITIPTVVLPAFPVTVFVTRQSLTRYFNWQDSLPSDTGGGISIWLPAGANQVYVKATWEIA